MCLIVDEYNALIAKEDITCYKIYIYSGYRAEYISPLQLDSIEKYNQIIHVPKF